jgi:hypothetical protein
VLPDACIYVCVHTCVEKEREGEMQPDICNADNEDCTADISAGPHTGIHSERQHMLSTHMQIM